MLKVTPQMATPGAESAVYDCRVFGCERKIGDRPVVGEFVFIQSGFLALSIGKIAMGQTSAS